MGVAQGKGAGRSMVEGRRINVILTRQTGRQEACHAKLIGSRRDDTTPGRVPGRTK